MNTDTLARSDVDLEALFKESISCSGYSILTGSLHRIIHTCDNEAVYVSHGHPNCNKVRFKCATCLPIWMKLVLKAIANNGHFTCSDCKQKFTDIDTFSQYRPL